MPPLIKGYLRGGASVLGAPAYDRQLPHGRPADHDAAGGFVARYREQFLLP